MASSSTIRTRLCSISTHLFFLARSLRLGVTFIRLALFSCHFAGCIAFSDDREQLCLWLGNTSGYRHDPSASFQVADRR